MRPACCVAYASAWRPHLIAQRPSLCRAAAGRLSHTRPIVTAVTKAEASDHQESWDVAGSGSRKEWQRDDLQVVLVHPQIPQNAGSIARTCAATSVALHLVKPLGFKTDDVLLKRAGLDYWPHVVVKLHDDWDAFYGYFQRHGGGQLVAYSKFGKVPYTAEGLYQRGGPNWLMFGAETSGLPPEAHEAATNVVKIPMVETHVRSLNLAVSAGVGVFEAIRQLDAHKVD